MPRKPVPSDKYEARKLYEKMGTLSAVDVRNLTGRSVGIKPANPEGKGMPKLKKGRIR